MLFVVQKALSDDMYLCDTWCFEQNLSLVESTAFTSGFGFVVLFVGGFFCKSLRILQQISC